jgi:hypothetical protein
MKLKPRDYNHSEAYCLMVYATEDRSEVETIWNSRDGVTPFCIKSRDGSKFMNHIDWHRDMPDPDFVPPYGSRVFIDKSNTDNSPKLKTIG